MAAFHRGTARLPTISSYSSTVHSSNSSNSLLTTSLAHPRQQLRSTRHILGSGTDGSSSNSSVHRVTQVRTIRLLRRPKRPYTFTQLVTLSDGSTYMQRTTSPEAVYRSVRDARNTLLWNPSSEKLLNVEADEAGRLKAFRQRFGRGWDAHDGAGAEVAREHGELEKGYRDANADGDGEGGLMDLLAEYAGEQEQLKPWEEEAVQKAEAKTEMKKGKK